MGTVGQLTGDITRDFNNLPAGIVGPSRRPGIVAEEILPAVDRRRVVGARCETCKIVVL
jgi:hypothetical protein